MIRALSCPTCRGDGVIWRAWRGGNDPDVRCEGVCEDCSGAGCADCEETGCAETATDVFVENGTRYLLCARHYAEWMEAANA